MRVNIKQQQKKLIDKKYAKTKDMSKLVKREKERENELRIKDQ